MKITKEDIQPIIDVLTEAESFRPLVKIVLETIKSYGPEIEEIPKAFSRWLVENKIESIKQYEDAGFSREESILMTLDDRASLTNAINNFNCKSKS